MYNNFFFLEEKDVLFVYYWIIIWNSMLSIYLYCIIFQNVFFTDLFPKKKKKESKYKSSREICILIFNRFSIQMYRNDIK